MSDPNVSDDDYLVLVKGADFRAGGHSILEAVDLEIASKQIVTVIGPNGSGKTTLVRVVLGLVNPGSGTVWRRPGLTVGYVPQRFHIDETMPLSVDRFLRLGMKCNRDHRLTVLSEVGAENIIDSPVQMISGGEMRRLLLARALLRDPDLLVLDEPASGVDINGQAELYGLIHRLRDRHSCGVLLVSHDLHLVMAETDHVVCLNHHVCCSGRPDDVSAHPEYLSLFGRELSRTHAVYTHRHDHEHTLSGESVRKEGHDHG